MSCSTIDVKDYVLGELAGRERSAVEDHVRNCASCREELERLEMTRSALAALEQEEIPRRISFVSDRVFEPRWWQAVWRSGPVMAFSAAALLAAAIVVHAFARPVAQPAPDAAAIEQRVEREVTARLDASVAKAVNAAEARQSAEFARVLDTTEKRFEAQRQADLAVVQQTARFYGQQMGRFMVASNETGSSAPQ